MHPYLLAALGLAALMAAAMPASARPAYSPDNQPNFDYQAPDGSYDSISDLSRAIWGVPCGMACTQRAEARWGLAPHRSHPYDRD